MPEPLNGRGDPKLPLEIREGIWDLAEQYQDSHLAAQPIQQGLLGWTFDPALPNTGSQPSLGVEYMSRVIPAKTQRCANAHLTVGGGGTTLVADQCFIGLRNAAGSLLAKSASVHTTLQTTGNKVIPWVTPVELVAGMPYWVCWVINGAATATILRAGSSDMVNIGCVTGQGRIQTLGSSLTDLAASVTMANADMTNQHSYWVGIS
jgi:hypothetical protein